MSEATHPQPVNQSELARFQQAFGAALAGQGATPVAGGSALARALAIHRNTSAKAAQDALAANYPVVRALFGDDAFSACAGAFVSAEPPREPRLNAYGAGFPAFLQDYAPAAELSYVPDVAALERLHVEALFAADATSLDGLALGAALDPEAVLRLHPATRFTAFPSPAVGIWLAHRDGDEAALGEIVWRPEAVLVTRPGLDVRVERINAPAVAFLSACASGQTLGVAATAAAEAGSDLPTMFAMLITAGAFA